VLENDGAALAVAGKADPAPASNHESAPELDDVAPTILLSIALPVPAEDDLCTCQHLSLVTCSV